MGYYTDSNYSFRAFLRSPDGKFKTWIGPDACTGNGSEGCFGSAASNINVFGVVAGGYEDDSGNFVHHGYLRNAEGKLKPFDVSAAGTGSYQGTGCPGCAVGLNLGGAIAGTYIDANSVQHGFLRSPNGTFTPSTPPARALAAIKARAAHPTVLQASTTLGPSWEPISTQMVCSTAICVVPTAILRRSILPARCLLGLPKSMTSGRLRDTMLT